jgi:uncharacterized membrane protein
MRARLPLREVFAALCIAVAVHIVAMLAAPDAASGDAWSRLKAQAPELAVRLIGGQEDGEDGGGAGPAMRDPALALAACHFDLANGPVVVRARTQDMFLSIGFRRRDGSVFWAVTERAAVRGMLEVVLGTPAQIEARGEEDDEDNPSGEVRVEAPVTRGFVVFRALAPRPSATERVRALVASATCERLE